MTLTLKRERYLMDRVEGSLFVDGVFQCFTLEPPRVQEYPPEDHPAIPPGTYPVAIRYSQKFKALVPHIDQVPGRTAIEIHAGNIAQRDSLGCILVGEQRLGAAILHSRDALQALMSRIAPSLARHQSVTLTVEESLPEGTQRA